MWNLFIQIEASEEKPPRLQRVDKPIDTLSDVEKGR